ncbi:hypothetical protein MRX96_002717 [Rhipicephalus microplus]
MQSHQSMDRVSDIRSLALVLPDASSRILEQGQNNIDALSQVSDGTLHRSSSSNNINDINSPRSAAVAP